MEMNTEIISYPSSNGTSDVCAKLFIPSGTEIKAILQISHGMCEYIDRYNDLARFLCEKGFLVCGNNHIGHRYSVLDDTALGFFAAKDGDQCLITDVHTLTMMMKERYPGKPYFLLGHSMGSFIARCCLAQFGADYDGAIISGTGGPNPMVKVGLTTASLLCKTKGLKSRSKMLDRMAFGDYNKRFENRTSKDWLTRDKAMIDAYVADPYCTFLFTNAAFRDLLTLTSAANAPDWAEKLPKDLPVYIFSGEEDPVGDYGAGVRKVYQMLKGAGLFDVALKLYPDGRHEMINEINRADVYTDICEWLRRKVV